MQPNNSWNEIFTQQGRVFTEPHEDMAKLVGLLQGKPGAAILDLGCGSGRHTVYFSRRGFSVYALDSAPEGIALARQWLAAEGLQADIRLHSMLEKLPYEDAFFDAVVSIQVIHHTTLANIRSIVGEIFRILKPGGIVFVTLTTLKHHPGEMVEIEPNTFVPQNGFEKGLPHHYFSPEELREVFASFRIEAIYIDQTEHSCLLARKP